jgi:hypothetical protein
MRAVACADGAAAAIVTAAMPTTQRIWGIDFMVRTPCQCFFSHRQHSRSLTGASILYHHRMPAPVHDVAQTRLDNALRLFDEFVRATVKHPDAATLRGLEGRFAERLKIQPSYWSQIKSRSRQIGERLARQFEQLCHKPVGWMDQRHDGSVAPTAAPRIAGAATAPETHDSPLPQDDDERFIVGLVLTYYRRHPQRARTRLLDLLGEVLMPSTPLAPAARAKAAAPAAQREDPDDLWRRTQSGVAPLKHNKR